VYFFLGSIGRRFDVWVPEIRVANKICIGGKIGRDEEHF